MTTHALSTSAAQSATVYAQLTEIEAARQRQLDALPSTNLDAVAAAYRATVERILDEVRSARHRAMAGLHGICTGCDTEISADRLEHRPWTLTCTQCAPRERS